MSTEIACSTPARAGDELGRAAADVDDQVRRLGASSPRTAPVKDSRASSSPRDHLGRRRRASPAPCRGSRRRSTRPGRPLVATIRTRSTPEFGDLARRTRQRHAGSARSPRRRAGRCGRRPRRAGRSPSAGPRRSAVAVDHVRDRAGGSSWCRSRSPRPSSSRSLRQVQQHSGVSQVFGLTRSRSRNSATPSSYERSSCS